MTATSAPPAWPLQDRALALPVLVGTGIGLAYGAALRLWMRFITTDPEFTWSGTGFIIGAFAVLGTTAGLAAAGRARGWRGGLVVTRVAGIVLSLACFGAAGALMFPTIVPADPGVARTDWPRPLRGVLVAVGIAMAGVVVLTMTDLSPARRLAALALYLPLCAVEVRLVTELYAPTVARGRVGRVARVAVPLAAALGGGVAILALVGAGA